MRKVSYSIGAINQNASLRFSISLKTQKSDFCVTTNASGDTMNIRNLYPSLSLIVTDEIRDTKGWNSSFDKTVSWSRFTGPRYVSRAKKFINDFISINELFRYQSGELILNMDLAKEISFTEVAEFERRVMTIPVIGKDLSMNQKYEGVGVFIGNMSNYVIFTYDEYLTLVNYLDDFRYDEMALQLLNVAIATKGALELEAGGLSNEPKNQDLTKWIDRPKTIPNL